VVKGDDDDDDVLLTNGGLGPVYKQIRVLKGHKHRRSL